MNELDPSAGGETLNYLMVLVGGGIGSLARYVASAALTARLGSRVPYATFIVNVTGSFLIGLLMTLFAERLMPHPNVRLLLVVGFLGGYTTFSTFEFETFRLTREGADWLALAYVLASVVSGLIAVWLGAFFAGRLGPNK